MTIIASALWVPILIMTQILILARLALWMGTHLIEATFSFCRVYEILRPGPLLRSSLYQNDDQIQIAEFSRKCLEPLKLATDASWPDSAASISPAIPLMESLEKEINYLKEFESQEVLLKKAADLFPDFSKDFMIDIVTLILREFTKKREILENILQEKIISRLEKDLSSIRSWKGFMRNFPMWSSFHEFCTLYNKGYALLGKEKKISFKDYFISNILSMPFDVLLYQETHLYDIAESESLDYFKNFFLSECVQRDSSLSRCKEEIFFDSTIHFYLVGGLLKDVPREQDHSYWTEDLFSVLETVRCEHQKKKDTDTDGMQLTSSESVHLHSITSSVRRGIFQ